MPLTKSVGNAHVDTRTGSWLALNADRAFKESDTFCHACQSKVSLSALLGHHVGIEAVAVVLNYQGDQLLGGGKRHLDMLRVRVPVRVGQGLLRYAVEARLDATGQRGESCRGAKCKMHRCPALSSIGICAIRQYCQRFRQRIALQGSGAQVHHRAACLFEVVASEAQGALYGAVSTLGAGCSQRVGSLQLQRDRRQSLRQSIVYLACQAVALLDCCQASSRARVIGGEARALYRQADLVANDVQQLQLFFLQLAPVLAGNVEDADRGVARVDRDAGVEAQTQSRGIAIALRVFQAAAAQHVDIRRRLHIAAQECIEADAGTAHAFRVVREIGWKSL